MCVEIQHPPLCISPTVELLTSAAFWNYDFPLLAIYRSRTKISHRMFFTLPVDVRRLIWQRARRLHAMHVVEGKLKQRNTEINCVGGDIHYVKLSSNSRIVVAKWQFGKLDEFVWYECSTITDDLPVKLRLLIDEEIVRVRLAACKRREFWLGELHNMRRMPELDG